MQRHETRIAVVAHGLRAGGGISVGANIIRALLKVRPENSYLLITPDVSDYRSIQAGPRVTLKPFAHRSYLHRAYFDRFSLPKLIRSFNPTIVFCLGNIPVKGIDAFQCLLIQNALLVYPDVRIPGLNVRDRFSIFAQASGIRRALAETDLVFCQTDAMRQHFARTFGFTRDILILPNAVSTEVTRSRDSADCALLPAPEGFRLFTLARYHPSKNLEAIVACFDRYRQDLQDVKVILTIAADHHPGARRLLADIRSKQLDGNIINIGPVPQALLSDYYRQVDGLLLPTLLESFSGTYLESMAFERSILTSNRDFAKETCGNAALYFDPLIPESMRDAIVRLKQDSTLRDTLVANGRVRLAQVTGTWESAVSKAIVEIESRLRPAPTRVTG